MPQSKRISPPPSRAQHISGLFEAVFSGMEPLGGRTQFETVLRRVYQILFDWKAYSFTGGVQGLATLLNKDETIQNGLLRFQISKHPRESTFLFINAGFHPNTLMIHVLLNPNFRAGSLSPTGLPQQIGLLRSTLQHEYVHMEQVSHISDTELEKRAHSHLIVNTMGMPKESLAQYKQKAGEYVRTHTPEGTTYRFARSVPSGSSPAVTLAQNWYQGLPEEIMGWAVGMGSLMSQIRRKPPLQTTVLIQRLHDEVWQILDRLDPQRTGDSLAFKRFKKSLLEYLVNHENYSPQVAVQDITNLFQHVRKVTQ